jgi:hypothetical protein
MPDCGGKTLKGETSFAKTGLSIDCVSESGNNNKKQKDLGGKCIYRS